MCMHGFDIPKILKVNHSETGFKFSAIVHSPLKGISEFYITHHTSELIFICAPSSIYCHLPSGEILVKELVIDIIYIYIDIKKTLVVRLLLT